MKQYCSLLLSFCMACICCYNLYSQPISEVNVISPLSQNGGKPLMSGGGIDVGLYSKQISLSGSKNKYVYPYKQYPNRVTLRLGVDLSVAFMGSKNFDHIPLLSPESGTASVNLSDDFFTADFDARLSARYFNGKINPYITGFTGMRILTSDMEIYPDDNSHSTDSSLAGTSGLCIGATGGILFKVGKDFFLNTGVTYSHSEVPGSVVDMHSIQSDGTTIAYSAPSSPEDFLVFKVGLAGYIDGEGGSGHHHSHYSGGHSHSGGGGHSHVSLSVH